MIFLRLTPVIISLLLIAAHFFRTGSYALVIYSGFLLLILFVRNRISARIVQISLVLASFEWVRTTIGLITQREDAGESWTRLAIILGAVALFTLLSAFMFNSKALRKRHKM
jgi:hypothetical protein